MSAQENRMRAPAIVVSSILLTFTVGCTATQPASRTWGRVAQPASFAASAPLPDAPVAAAASQPVALSTRPEAMKVMTFTLCVPFLLDAWTFWSLRRQLVVETIKRFDPDILGTQECPNTSATFLRASLPGYQFVGVGRDDGKTRGEM